MGLLQALEFEHSKALGRPISEYDFNPAAAHREFTAVTLDGARHLLHKLPIKIRICYLNVVIAACSILGIRRSVGVGLPLLVFGRVTAWSLSQRTWRPPCPRSSGP